MRRPRCGFTIVELVLTSVIMVGIATVLLVFAVTGRRVWGVADVQLTSLNEAQRAMNRLTEDLREATQASLNCGAVLSFQRFGGGATTYRIIAGKLTRDTGAGPQPIASGAETFMTACPSPLVRISLTVQATTLEGRSVQTLDSSVFVRAP